MDEPGSGDLLAELGEVESYVDVPAAVEHLGEADPAHPALPGLLALLGEEPEFEPDVVGDPDVVPSTPSEFDPYLRALALMRLRGELAPPMPVRTAR